MGEVTPLEDAPIEAGVEVVRGAKGVDGGSVQVVGAHSTSREQSAPTRRVMPMRDRGDLEAAQEPVRGD